MRKISEVFGKSLEPEINRGHNNDQDQDIFDPGSHESKLEEANAIPIPTPTIDNGNGKDNDKENKKKAHFVQKHSETDLIAEAVIVAGIPYFAVARASSNEIALEKSLSINDTSEYRPFESRAYLNKPYVFKSKQDFESCVEKASGATLDSLYRKVKSIWSKYIDADDFQISICAADTIFTYYQDMIGLTHYLFFVGNNGSGKSNNLTVLHFLAYRNFTSTDMTAANIYQFLGSEEEGQGTLCEDEADRIDEDRQKMAIYKNGYITGFPVARTDTSFGRTQLRLNTFCLKAFAAERLPDALKAKGFNQRIIELQCLYGFPKYDISEVANPAGEQEFQVLLDELNETRNLLLTYRLLHFRDKIPDIKLNIQNREKQLFKPVLRIFQNTETLNDLLPVISKYVTQKRESNTNTFYAFLYRTIGDLIKVQDTTELESSLIWNYITEILPGEFNPHKKLSYESSEFGTISQKGIIEMLMQVFAAKHSPNKREKRKLIFDLVKFERLGKVYDISLEIQVGRPGADVTDGADIGLDKHLTQESTDIEITEKSAEYNNSYSNLAVNNQDFRSVELQTKSIVTVHPSQTPHPSSDENVCSNVKPMTQQEAFTRLGLFETEKESKDQYAAFIENFYSNTDPFPVAEHSLEGSPCELIIGDTGKLYYCKIHPKIESPFLEIIEQHCKYKEPEQHKSEILRIINDDE